MTKQKGGKKLYNPFILARIRKKFMAAMEEENGASVAPLHDGELTEKPSAHFTSSVSAQDLAALVIEEEGKRREHRHEEISPRGVLEECMGSPESETSPSEAKATLSASSTAAETSMACRRTSLWKGFLRMWKHKSMRRLASFPPLGPRLSRRQRNREAGAGNAHGAFAEAVNGFCLLKPSWKNFSLGELKKATDNFSKENIVGKGGFAKVYKGCLESGQLVAVKRLTQEEEIDRINNFLSEMGVILHVNHPNIAKLVGIGAEGGEHLVFPLSTLGSLSTLLHGSKENIDWDARYKIALGTARGIEYLHERCARRIIHRDIKAANILLREDFEPQICDFGLAKWLPEKLTHHQVSTFEGTFGYMAPEYSTHGIINEKTDVFAYGVLLLELITGRKALDRSRQSLVLWAKPFLDQGQIMHLIDPSLSGKYDLKQLNHVAQAAHMCIQLSPALRPQISQVLKLLRGEEDHLKKKPIRRTYSVELDDADDYNATRFLSNLSRHKEIAYNFNDDGIFQFQ